jgi:single-stranded-DNA-specific exonuclease
VSRWSAAHEACRHLAGALSKGERIHIHGDYDVDGITSVGILAAALRRAGGKVTFGIPNRFRDGYGLSPSVVRDAADRGAEVLVAIDCGTNDFPAQEEALKSGLDLLILDHHIPRDSAAVKGRLVNPHLPGCPGALKHLTSAGIAFEVALGLGDFTGRRESAVSLSRLACLGIAQDVAPLIEDNRIIVKLGMEHLPATKNLFLKGLLASSGVAGSALRSYHLFYRLGPRLNAPGRLEDATFLVDLLLDGREDAVFRGLEKLEGLNRERQALQEKIVEAALAQADPDAPCIIAAGEGWHLGVVGLAAGKLAARFNRPSFVFSLQETHARGSGRSVPGISLVETLQPAAGLFTSFGGHASACGITVARNRWEVARTAILEAFSRLSLPEEGPGMDAEEEITFVDLDGETCDLLEAMEPFGSGNPRPTFMARDVEVLGEPAPIRQYGFRFLLRQAGRIFPATLFGTNSLPDLPRPFCPVFGVSRYRGADQLDLEGYLP